MRVVSFATCWWVLILVALGVVLFGVWLVSWFCCGEWSGRGVLGYHVFCCVGTCCLIAVVVWGMGLVVESAVVGLVLMVVLVWAYGVACGLRGLGV